ncbi:MAG TPA: aminotransferase class IV [Pirellulales bacterium]|jgi:branched-subunit amino acid aminotransferase/4-amino-4-deoxychorismate lyase|nr:aminotransferase class IV [Pirellulales bacterium]
MTEPQAYLNGNFVAGAQASISVVDGGFVQGTTVAEQLRTFGGELFQLEAHIERLFRSLAIVEVDPGLTSAEFARIAQELAEMNHALVATGDDLGMAMFVTPGAYPAMLSGKPAGATVCMHTFPLHFHLWAHKYQSGESLSTTDVAQVPAACWPPELKCRSRMHYYLADKQARTRYPDSRALMLDENGFVTETTSSNIVLYRNGAGLVMPPREKVLPGISLAVLLELAEQLAIEYVERDLTTADVAAADEVFLTSTSPCVLPVVRINGQEIGRAVPGEIYRRFISTWSDLVGIDIARQAERFAVR